MAEGWVKAAQGCSIVGAAFLSGFIACFSRAGVPTLSLAPVDVLVHESKVMYNIGKSTSPLIAVAVTVCNIFAAYVAWTQTRLIGGLVSPFALYCTAALCISSIVPFTMLYMDPAVNNKLLALGTRVEKGGKSTDFGISEMEIRSSLRRWRGMNYLRAAVVGVGSVMAAIATMT